MGDRNNIKITYGTGDSIYLYGHWIGNQVREIVANAVEASNRVTDESYFARVLFCAMVAESDDLRGETGYGIAPYAPDQDYSNKMIHVDYTQAWNNKGVPQVDYEYDG